MAILFKLIHNLFLATHTGCPSNTWCGGCLLVRIVQLSTSFIWIPTSTSWGAKTCAGRCNLGPIATTWHPRSEWRSSVRIGWWSTPSTYPMVKGSNIQWHFEHVHWICHQKIWTRYHCVWWLSKLINQRHDSPKMSKLGATMTFTENMHLTITKNEFLTNKANKQRFVNMLCEALEKKNCNSYYASADVDLLIVEKAVESATKTDTLLVGDDTDLLVLLSYYASLEYFSLFFRPKPQKNFKNPRVLNIQAVKQQLRPEICNHILFLHAILSATQLLVFMA